MVVSSMPVQQDVTVTVTAKPPPGPRRPTVHKAPTPPPIDQPAGRATTPSTEGTDELVATPLIRKRKRSGSQDPPEWFRGYMLEHSQRLDRLDAHNERLTALAEQKNRLLERLVEALTSNKS
ncbi:hypothetical protein DPMN_030166 [Dreissena polymorpha]|uniref:Uncharacterized protein n=1 Tax=Dreissena polymorpha TaxID=45954 RepID=A0A9D4M245_DREPO|nr:hypothetical protein DPMN_030166 [Dreissena polymorpha]